MIKSALKSLLIKYLNTKHLTIVPFDTNDGKIEKVKYYWLIDQNINMIIDVGASNGVFASKIRKYFPNTLIYSFEPIPDSYRKLVKRFKSDIYFKAFNIALGNTSGKLKFNQNVHVGSSSFLEMSTLHKEAHPHTKNYSKINVRVDKLDNLINFEDEKLNIFLKLDVQGYERFVIEGADQLLQKVKVIYTEVSFNELYKGQSLINEIIYFLEEKGFKMVGVEDVSRSVIDGTFLQANVFFTRNM